jgi:DNA invertase Pin-like site-specific DNA recombinase
VSGAEFANRPGFVRLMGALKPRPPFQVLIMSEESRLGREAIETAYALKQLITAGVRVFFHLEDRERTFDSPIDKLLMSVTAYADELEREKAGLRVYDAMRRKAAAGQVTGARVRLPQRRGARLGRQSVTRRTAHQRGGGGRRAAHLRDVRRRRGPDPYHQGAQRGQRADAPPTARAPRGWVGSTVRDVLLRELYRGVIVWNQTRKRDRWGQHHQHARPESEWMRVPAALV